MDFILFFIGLYSLLRNKLSVALAIIFILTSTYLQLPVISKFWIDFIFPHNVSDIGILLYIVLFIKAVNSGFFHSKNPLSKVTLLLIGFLILNGIYDMFKGTSILDVITFLKLKFIITIVFISSIFNRKTVVQAYRYVLYITVFFCIIQILSRLFDIELIELSKAEDDRGAKPVFSVMLFALIPLANLFKQSLSKRLIYGIIIVLPIIMNMKMTYAGTVLISFVIFIFINNKISKSKRIKYIAVIGAAALGVLSFSGSFSARFNEMSKENVDINSTSSDGNFSYRILHAYERFNYIGKTIESSIRGIGYVSEKNFKKEPFIFGQYSERLNKISQLDTGDIAWSIFFLRYGLLGITIYLYYYFTIINQYRHWKCKSVWKYYWISILITFLLFTSIGNTIIEGYYFFIFPILFIMTYHNENNSYNILLQSRRS